MLLVAAVLGATTCATGALPPHGGDAAAAPGTPSPPVSPSPHAAAPATTLAASGLRYRRAPGALLDLHVLPSAAPPPAVLVVHGGGWSGGDRGRMTAVSASLAHAGFAAFNVGYSLARPWRPGYRRQLADLQAAVGWIRRHAPRLGVDASRMGAVGSSAGGQLVALLATVPRQPGSRRALDAVVTWSAPLDLPALAGHPLAPAVGQYLGCLPRACPRRAADASPLRHVDPGDPPMLVANSTSELTPLEQATTMAARLAAAGVPHALWTTPGSLHAREYAPLVLPATVAFLRARLR